MIEQKVSLDKQISTLDVHLHRNMPLWVWKLGHIIGLAIYIVMFFFLLRPCTSGYSF